VEEQNQEEFTSMLKQDQRLMSNGKLFIQMIWEIVLLNLLKELMIRNMIFYILWMDLLVNQAQASSLVVGPQMILRARRLNFLLI
jgi:hypothetical protein